MIYEAQRVNQLFDLFFRGLIKCFRVWKSLDYVGVHLFDGITSCSLKQDLGQVDLPRIVCRSPRIFSPLLFKPFQQIWDRINEIFDLLDGIFYFSFFCLYCGLFFIDQLFKFLRGDLGPAKR